MTNVTRPRRRESQRTGGGQPERSRRYRHLVNPFEPVRIFSDDQIESMHLAALGILERQGMRVLSARGRALLAAAGARVDEASNMVRLDPAQVSAALASVPAENTLVARNPERSCRVGGPHVVFAPVAGPPSVNDLERGKRTGSLDDFRDFVRLAQSFDVIHVLAQMKTAGTRGNAQFTDASRFQAGRWRRRSMPATAKAANRIRAKPM